MPEQSACAVDTAQCTRAEQEQAAAFYVVALCWLGASSLACKMIAVAAASEVLMLGTVWLVQGNLMAPVAAALCVHAVDFARARQISDEQVSSMQSSSGGSCWLDVD
jgi:hypothetical protein